MVLNSTRLRLSVFDEYKSLLEKSVTYLPYTSADEYYETMDIQFVIKSKSAKDITKSIRTKRSIFSKVKVIKAENNTIY